MGKEAVKRTGEEALHVVQGGHIKFTHALPRRNFGQYVEEQLVLQNFDVSNSTPSNFSAAYESESLSAESLL